MSYPKNRAHLLHIASGASGGYSTMQVTCGGNTIFAQCKIDPLIAMASLLSPPQTALFTGYTHILGILEQLLKRGQVQSVIFNCCHRWDFPIPIVFIRSQNFWNRSVVSIQSAPSLPSRSPSKVRYVRSKVAEPKRNKENQFLVTWQVVIIMNIMVVHYVTFAVMIVSAVSNILAVFTVSAAWSVLPALGKSIFGGPAWSRWWEWWWWWSQAWGWFLMIQSLSMDLGEREPSTMWIIFSSWCTNSADGTNTCTVQCLPTLRKLVFSMISTKKASGSDDHSISVRVTYVTRIWVYIYDLPVILAQFIENCAELHSHDARDVQTFHSYQPPSIQQPVYSLHVNPAR